MGWCQEFGLQITEGCDQVMVAGHDSCSCPDCGVVCPGRFAGCSMVWVADGELVALPAPRLAVGSGPVLILGQPSATNGHSPRAVAENGGPGTDYVSLPAAVQVAEFAQVTPVTPPSKEQSASPGGAASPVVQPGPDSESLRELLEDLKLEVRRLSRTVGRLADAPEPPSAEAILLQVDGRFEWLTKQLSDRLVVLGNEIVAMKRYLARSGDDGT